jgi:hypothetical protein
MGLLPVGNQLPTKRASCRKKSKSDFLVSGWVASLLRLSSKGLRKAGAFLSISGTCGGWEGDPTSAQRKREGIRKFPSVGCLPMMRRGCPSKMEKIGALFFFDEISLDTSQCIPWKVLTKAWFLWADEHPNKRPAKTRRNWTISFGGLPAHAWEMQPAKNRGKRITFFFRSNFFTTCPAIAQDLLDNTDTPMSQAQGPNFGNLVRRG